MTFKLAARRSCDGAPRAPILDGRLLVTRTLMKKSLRTSKRRGVQSARTSSPRGTKVKENPLPRLTFMTFLTQTNPDAFAYLQLKLFWFQSHVSRRFQTFPDVDVWFFSPPAGRRPSPTPSLPTKPYSFIQSCIQADARGRAGSSGSEAQLTSGYTERRRRLGPPRRPFPVSLNLYDGLCCSTPPPPPH